MLNIYVDNGMKEVELFKQVLSTSNSKFNVFSSLDDVLPEQVDVAIIWLKIPDCLFQFTNLKLLLISGSGIDHLIAKGNLPVKVPTVRIVDDRLRNKVADYVITAVEKFQQLVEEQENSNITVGMMGLGLIGERSVNKLLNKGYHVISWVKGSKKRRVNDVYVGKEQLIDFVSKVQVLVCQLPLTTETQNILNEDLFKEMPKGSYIVNVGRGGHLNEVDLMKSIASGHLKGACLDVFKVEPLSEDSILRKEPLISLTPHIAGGIFPEEQAKYASSVIKTFFAKGEVEGAVDYNLNY